MTSRKNGNITELKFALAATENGLIVSRPISGGQRYDFIIDNSGALARVQVKASSERGGQYEVMTAYGSKTKRSYSQNDVDFIAVMAGSDWYIIPTKKLLGRKRVNIKPGNRGEFEKFKNRWEIVKPNMMPVPPKRTMKPAGAVYERSNGYFIVRLGTVHKNFKRKVDAEDYLQDLRNSIANSEA